MIIASAESVASMSGIPGPALIYSYIPPPINLLMVNLELTDAEWKLNASGVMGMLDTVHLFVIRFYIVHSRAPGRDKIFDGKP